jgi:hypothetical protein
MKVMVGFVAVVLEMVPVLQAHKREDIVAPKATA